MTFLMASMTLIFVPVKGLCHLGSEEALVPSDQNIDMNWDWSHHMTTM